MNKNLEIGNVLIKSSTRIYCTTRSNYLFSEKLSRLETTQTNYFRALRQNM